MTMFNKERVENTIETALRRKLRNYNPEPSHMPFHTRLLGRDRMAIYSFIHSLNTNFGTAIFERVAQEIATGEFDQAALQYQIKGDLSDSAQSEITRIMNGLSAGSRIPNHAEEVERLRAVVTQGQPVAKRMRKVDVFLSKGNAVFLMDLKTAKPNISGFEKYKQDMLEWVAAVLRQNPSADVRIIVAIPYNPYEPKPYNRWTLRGMLEIENQSQLMVGSEFWNFLAGGENIYQDLLDCFERVGQRMSGEIDSYFKKIGAERYI